MRAARVARFGGPEVLEVVDLPDPHPGPGEVRIAVRAACASTGDCVRRGGQGGEELPLSLGHGAAGVVDELGEGVEDIVVGERVLGLSAQPGAQAELVVLAQYAPIPRVLDFADAAALLAPLQPGMPGLALRDEVDALVEAQRLAPPPTAIPLGHVVEAHRILESGRAPGAVVLAVEPEEVRRRSGATPHGPEDPGPFFHGTKAALAPGDLLEAGRNTNFGRRRAARYVYLAGTLDAATWGAELADGDGPGHVYVVEPTGAFEDDPNVTDKKFPGNPTRSYRTREPLRVVEELTDWQPHPPEVLRAMRERVAEMERLGIEAIED